MKKTMVLLFAFLLLYAGGALAGSTVIPASVTAIPDQAFYGDTALTEAVLPEGLTKIGAKAFYGSGLKKINLPAALTEIGQQALPAGTACRRPR